jgi:PAS domain S-box-containing protein
VLALSTFDKSKQTISPRVKATQHQEDGTQLNSKNDYFYSLFENSFDGLLVTKPDGSILSANSAACNMFGMTEDELRKVGRKGVIVLDEKAKAALSLREREGKAKADLTLKRKDGSVFDAEVSSSLFTDGEGTVKTSMVIRDITERKRMEGALRQSEERFFKAFQLNPTPMAIAFIDGEFIDVNRSFERLMGFKRDEVIGKRGEDLGIYGKASEREELIRKLQRNGHVYNFPMTFNTKSMKKINVLFSRELIKLQNKTFILGAAIDITEKTQLQNELAKHSHSLEELVKQKTEQLREKERLAAIGETAGMVGHDIRNPLQSIIGDLYLAFYDLSSIADCEEKESLKESLLAIQKNVDYINKIISDLQDFVRPLKLVIGKVDLEGLIEEMLLTMEIPENIQVSCRVEADVKLVKSDADFLRRVLGNLISNAVQAMPDGGELSVHAYREISDVAITVADSGVGIPKSIQDTLFTPLFTTKSKGQGFGLAVVKRLTEALGGNVTFESEEGTGAKFTVRLPVAKK